jgi:hypothetical protein
MKSAAWVARKSARQEVEFLAASRTEFPFLEARSLD